jgi:hypothetical protein
MPLGQAPDEATGFDGGVGAAFFEVGTSGIDELAAGGCVELTALGPEARGAVRPRAAFGFAPAQAAASTTADKANVRARRTSGP